MTVSNDSQPDVSAVIDRSCVAPYEVAPGVTVRCGSRVKSKCPGDAELYRGDWHAIARSGVFDGDAGNFGFFLQTVTAPSFGRTHLVPNVAKGKTAVNRPCSCGIWHTVEDAGLLGVPVDMATYDYAGQVAWNRDMGVLWTNTVRRLRDRWPGVEFFIVREVQARGVLHTHVLVRIPRAEAPSAAELRDAARSATAFSKIDGVLLEWGEQADCQQFRADADGGRAISYLSKALNYVLKDVVRESGEAGAAWLHLARLHAAAQSMRCSRECVPDQCNKAVHRRFGMCSHVVSQSRRTKHRPGWSFTGLNRTVQRRLRREWWLAKTADKDAAAAPVPVVPVGIEQVAKTSRELVATARGSSP